MNLDRQFAAGTEGCKFSRIALWTPRVPSRGDDDGADFTFPERSFSPRESLDDGNDECERLARTCHGLL